MKVQVFRKVQDPKDVTRQDADNSMDAIEPGQNPKPTLPGQEITNLDIKQTECVICMADFESGDRLINFGCTNEHRFHEDCLSKWLAGKESCPLCKEQAV